MEFLAGIVIGLIVGALATMYVSPKPDNRAKLQAGAGTALQVVEGLALVSVALWAFVGAWDYGRGTGWTFRGLLTLLDERWRGTLILAGLLFYRSLQEVLARTKKFRVPWGEVGETVEPAAQPEQVARPNQGG